MDDRRSAFLKRLPFLALIAVGLWLWQSDLFPQERQIVWTLEPGAASIERVEIQLWRGEELLKREEFFTRGEREVRQTVLLRPGEYRVEAFAYAAGAGAGPQHWMRTLEISEAKAYGEVLGQ